MRKFFYALIVIAGLFLSYYICNLLEPTSLETIMVYYTFGAVIGIVMGNADRDEENKNG